MKTIKYLLAFIIISGIFVHGCSEDFLEKEKLGEPDITNFYQTPGDLKMALNAAYGSLQLYGYMTSRFMIGDIVSDDAMKGSEAGDFKQAQELKEHRANANNLLLSWKWDPLYKGIFRSNIVLKEIEEVKFDDKALKARMKAEAKFIRGFCYYELVRTWGGVPLITEPLTGDYDMPKASAEEVWNQIENDFADAAPDLWNKSQYGEIGETGRATKEAAFAFLGKAHLYQEEWEEAKPALDDAITQTNEDGYQLVDDMGSIFEYEGENGPGSLFEIQFMEEGDNGDPFRNEGKFSTVFQMNRSNWGWGFNQPTHDLIDEYGYFQVTAESIDSLKNHVASDDHLSNIADDLSAIQGEKYLNVEDFFTDVTNIFGEEDANKYRNTLIICNFVPTDPRYDEWFIADGEVINGEKQDHHSVGNNTGYFSAKEFLGPNERPSHWRLSAVNERILRLADVYLMYAEAACETNDLATAKTYLNKVRQRAGVSLFPNYADNEGNEYTDGNQASLRKAIRNERRLELAMEHQRCFDLIRWKELKNKLPENYPNYYKENPPYRFPIPQDEIDVTNGVVKQNPAWH